MKKILAVFTLTIVLTLGLFAVPAGATSDQAPTDEAGNVIYTEMYFKYIIEDGSICIVDFFGDAKAREKAVVPMSIAGYPVNYIAPGALVGSGIKELWLPNILMITEGELFNGQYFDEGLEPKFYHKNAKGEMEETEFTFLKDTRPEVQPTNPTKPSEENPAGPVPKTWQDFEYLEYGSYVVITGYTGTDKVVIIPSHIVTRPVKTVQGNAFSKTLYDEVRIPSGVGVDGLINAKKTVLNYEDKAKAVTFEKENSGNEDIMEIDLEQLDESIAAESNRETEESESPSEEKETDESGNVVIPVEEKSNLWIWLLAGIGGVAVLGGGAVLFLTKKNKKED